MSGYTAPADGESRTAGRAAFDGLETSLQIHQRQGAFGAHHHIQENAGPAPLQASTLRTPVRHCQRPKQLLKRIQPRPRWLFPLGIVPNPQKHHGQRDAPAFDQHAHAAMAAWAYRTGLGHPAGGNQGHRETPCMTNALHVQPTASTSRETGLCRYILQHRVLTADNPASQQDRRPQLQRLISQPHCARSSTRAAGLRRAPSHRRQSRPSTAKPFDYIFT